MNAEGKPSQSRERHFIEAGIGRDLSITQHEPTMTKDGHSAYRSTAYCFFIPAGIALRTQMLTNM